MTTQLSPLAIQHFTDNNGNLLAGGQLYTYAAGTSTPLATYTDSTGGTPNANPVIMNARGEANVWTTGGLAYKFVLEDASGVTIWTVDNITDGSLDSMLAAALASTATGKGADLVGFLQAGTGAVARTSQDKEADSVSVFDYLTKAQQADITARTLTLDVSASLQAILANFDHITFESGSYYLGSYSTYSTIFSILNRTVNIQNRGDVEFVLSVPAGVGTLIPIFFSLYNAPNSKFGTFRFRTINYDNTTDTPRGGQAFVMTADATSGTWGGVHIDGVICYQCVTAVSFQGADATNRVSGVTIDLISINDTYYGLNSQNQGDNVTVSLLSGTLVKRIYYVYGCTGHKVNIWNSNLDDSDGHVNISRSTGGFNTSAIDINYVSRDTPGASGTVHVKINHIDLLGGSISGININLNIDSPASFLPVYFVNYDGSGNPTFAASSNVVDSISIRGNVGPLAQAIDAHATYATTEGALNFDVDNGSVTADIRAAFNLKYDTGTWTPVLYDGSFSNLGQTASVAVGTYTKIGNMVFFKGRLTMSSLGTLNTTNAAAIGGLPFLSAGTSNTFSTVHFGFGSSLNLATASGLTGYIGTSANRISLQKFSATTGTASIAVSEITAAGGLVFSGFYSIS